MKILKIILVNINLINKYTNTHPPWHTKDTELPSEIIYSQRNNRKLRIITMDEIKRNFAWYTV